MADDTGQRGVQLDGAALCTAVAHAGASLAWQDDGIRGAAGPQEQGVHLDGFEDFGLSVAQVPCHREQVRPLVAESPERAVDESARQEVVPAVLGHLHHRAGRPQFQVAHLCGDGRRAVVLVDDDGTAVAFEYGPQPVGIEHVAHRFLHHDRGRAVDLVDGLQYVDVGGGGRADVPERRAERCRLTVGGDRIEPAGPDVLAAGAVGLQHAPSPHPQCGQGVLVDRRDVPLADPYAGVWHVLSTVDEQPVARRFTRCRALDGIRPDGAFSVLGVGAHRGAAQVCGRGFLEPLSTVRKSAGKEFLAHLFARRAGSESEHGGGRFSLAYLCGLCQSHRLCRGSNCDGRSTEWCARVPSISCGIRCRVDCCAG